MLHLAIALFTLPDGLHFAVLCSVIIAGYMSYVMSTLPDGLHFGSVHI